MIAYTRARRGGASAFRLPAWSMNREPSIVSTRTSSTIGSDRRIVIFQFGF